MDVWRTWNCANALLAILSGSRPPPCLILIGAEPFTQWLPDPVERDRWGFILTGADVRGHWTRERAPFFLETSMPGVFAAGDVRHGSVKRAASAVGEGSIAVRPVHEYLDLR
jgi:thioredoxin reductase (NADPH)